MKKISLFLSALFLTACSQEPLVDTKPVQKMQVQKIDKVSQTGSAKLYQCKDNQQVRAVYTQHITKNNKTLNKVSITYKGMTQKLILTISERGQNYSNIHWQWQERADYSLLKTTVGEVLAEKCELVEK